MSQNKVLKRKDVPIEKTWDTTPIFKDNDAFEEAFTQLTNDLDKPSEYQGKLAQSAQTLKEALALRNDLLLRLQHLYVYAHLNSDVDTTDSYYRGLENRTKDLAARLSSSLAYYDTELLEADEQTLKEYLKEDDLQIYQHEFEILFKQRKHILSLKEENLLAKASNVLDGGSGIFAIMNNADLKFPDIQDEKGNKVPLNHARYNTYLESTNRQVREDAFKSFYSVYDQFQNTLSSTLSNHVKTSNFYADIRHFDSARHYALFNNHIDEKVYDALIEAVNEKLPSLHRYVDLRKNVLGQDDLRMYDLYVSMVDKVDMKFSFEEAQELILDALAVLGDDYLSILHKAFNERWIDAVENEGKRSGAYSSGTYGTHPYILMSWQSTLDNVYTLAHELGHSVHSYYTRNNQPYIYGNYSIFLAEVASTTNENLLTDYLLKKYDDPKIQAYVINHYLDGVKGTIYRQTQFAEFEHLIHQADQKGLALTAQFLNQEYFDLNKKYYGPAMSYDDEIRLEWSRIPHFYYNYYVYQYATGFSAASALAQKILTEGKPAVDAYINYLKAGSSDYPIEVLKKAGVDMSTNQPTKDALDVFDQRLEQLEKLLLD